jgi:hypothetical protein
VRLCFGVGGKVGFDSLSGKTSLEPSEQSGLTTTRDPAMKGCRGGGEQKYLCIDWGIQ